MTKNVFKWAFIGAGGIARSVAKRITEKSGHKIVAVYNRTFERAQKLAYRYGAKAYDGLEQAITESGADGVYINVTNNAHYDCCLRALDCGKPVLMEKPFTTNAQQARELFALAEKKGTYLCEAMWTWFSDQAAGVKNAVDSGEIGNIKRGEITLCLPIAFGKSSRLLKSELAGGALLDLGVYPVTYAYRLFGMPDNIKSSARFKFGVDMSDDITFEYGGFDINIKISVRSLRGVGERLVLIGDKGRITAGAYHSGGGFTVKANGKKVRRAPDKNAMLTQFDRVADEMRGGKTKSEFVPPEATIAIMELLDSIRSAIGLKFSFE